MNPVSYQSIPPSMDGGHPNLSLDRVLSTSKVMCCEKCGFASTDVAVFKKHMLEHMGTRFYCFYCYKVAFSEAELKAHLKEHTKYPFKCPHCGQGYMRRLCLVKHIERLHSKSVSQGPTKLGMTKTPLLPVSSALQSVPTADQSTLQPVRITLPTHSTPAVRLDKNEQKGKALDTNLPNATNLSPLGGLIQHHRALTVSLPDEVTIPAGCLVELVEVKTVNGTKELKLRLVSQQENESVIKDARTTVQTLSSKLNLPNTAKSTNMEMCTLNRKQCETKAVNAERPAVVPMNISNSLSNQVSKEKHGLKRTSQEVINLECHPGTPYKVSKSLLSLVRERSSGVPVIHREPVNHSVAPPTVISTRVPNRLTSALHPENMGTPVSLKTVDERKTFFPPQLRSIAPMKASDVKSTPQDLSAAVKMESCEVHVKNNTGSKITSTGVMSQQSLKSSSPSLNVPSAAAVQVRPPVISVCKDSATLHSSFPGPHTARKTLNEPSSVKKTLVSNCTNSKIPSWKQEVRSNVRTTEGDLAEREGFPVISSVFSLSQQPEDVQGSIQPLVMALRGIVMDKTKPDNLPRDNLKIKISTKQEKEAPKSEGSAQVDIMNVTLAQLLTERTNESMKLEEHDKGIQQPLVPIQKDVHVKEEMSSSAPKNETKYCHTPNLKPADEESVSKCVSDVVPDVVPAVVPAVTTVSLQQTPEPELSSKFLTVSLKRVDESIWRKSQKGLKLTISKYRIPIGTLSNCAVLHPTPLKVNQLVKRPGPNQPVVVLNHPKPRASMQERADTVTDTAATEAVPKCQILKMRLSKVMGQKYEVLGCTVRVSP